MPTVATPLASFGFTTCVPLAILWGIVSIPLVFMLGLMNLAPPILQPEVPSVDMTGQVVIVTGSNTGIGKNTAAALYAKGATVIMACRPRCNCRRIPATDHCDMSHQRACPSDPLLGFS